MHISEKMEEAKKAGRVSFSFEFFPPKTAQVSSFSSSELYSPP
jgi:5,10-methylenetetrahydrofolate reductase